MKIRVFISGQYLPHPYECKIWTVQEGDLIIINDEDKPIAYYPSACWDFVKVVDDDD